MTYESVRMFVSKETTVNFQLERSRRRSFRNLSFYLCPAYVLTEEKIVCQKCNHPRYDNSIHLVTAVFLSHFSRNCHRDLPGRGRNFFDRSKDKCDFVKHGRQNYEKYGNRAAENHQRMCTLINPFTICVYTYTFEEGYCPLVSKHNRLAKTLFKKKTNLFLCMYTYMLQPNTSNSLMRERKKEENLLESRIFEEKETR